MKNRLLATFLTLATVPFFANAKPTNAELLTHLKQVKAELELTLTELSKVSSRVKTIDNDMQHYRDIENASIEYYNLLKAEFFLPIIDKTFNSLCTQLKPLDGDEFEISEYSMDNFRENHKKKIESILKKYDKYGAQKKNELTLKERTDYFFNEPYNSIIATMISIRETSTTLLKKINAKIAELSLPFEALAK